jgi:hypothetical protein
VYNFEPRRHEANIRGGGKPFTSSLNYLQKPAVGRGWGGVTPPLTTTLFPADPWVFSYKDDVTFILLLGVFLLLCTHYSVGVHFSLLNGRFRD